MKSAYQMKKGFVLPLTIVLMAVAAAVVSGIAVFVTNAARQTQIHLARSRCRFAAQSAIEQVKDQIWCNFYDDEIGTSSAATSVKIDPKSAQIYNEWFSKLDLSEELNINGCKVYVWASKDKIEFCEKNCSKNYGTDSHLNAGIRVLVPILATAIYTGGNGHQTTITLLEHVAFGTGQSEVFDYAYFVNNYGWMSGDTITINGDMRANGNVSLSQATVNGFVYAAANDELGVDGTVTLTSSPKIKNTSAYRSSAGNRARPDIDDYNTNKAYDAPASSGTIRKPTYDSNGNVTSAGTIAADSGEYIVKEYSNSLPMPFISELDSYVTYAQEENGSLYCPSVTYTDSLGEEKTVSVGYINNAHHSGAGPSGDTSAADKGALVLVGTQADPIVINGPVVVDSDVIIKGYVKGQGTIYSGRNIHIIGDIKYVNPPNWGHTDSDDESVETSNSKKDMLGLMAKGNVVIGDYTDVSSSSGGGWNYGYSSKSWYETVANYITPGASGSVVHSYACDESDANIGYPKDFDGNYTAVEKVSNLSTSLALSAPGGYDTASGQFGKVRTKTVTLETTHEEAQYDRWGRYTGTKTVYDTKTELATSYDRKYYESVCDDAIVKSLVESGICQIDAVMYNNHGTFGTLGKSGSYVNINGSLICRDEALIYTAAGLRFNWDMRLRSKTSKNMNTSLPPGPQSPFTYSWMQVADDLNVAYVNRGKTTTGGNQ